MNQEVRLDPELLQLRANEIQLKRIRANKRVSKFHVRPEHAHTHTSLLRLPCSHLLLSLSLFFFFLLVAVRPVSSSLNKRLLPPPVRLAQSLFCRSFTPGEAEKPPPPAAGAQKRPLPPPVLRLGAGAGSRLDRVPALARESLASSVQ